MNGRALLNLLSDRPVAYHPDIARIVGSVKAAIFLCQLLYWTGKGKRADGFIWKTQAEMETETALTRSEQETARKKLKRLGILEEKLHGIPAKLHYRINAARLLELIEAFYDNQDCGKPANCDAGNLQTITEITTEITDNTADAVNATDAPPNPPKPKKIKPKTPIPPAVRIFRENAHRYPAKAWYARIDAAVGETPENLARWGELVLTWVGRGYNPTNVVGMLDAFNNGGLQSQKGGKDANHTRRPIERAVSSSPAADLEIAKQVLARQRRGVSQPAA